MSKTWDRVIELSCCGEVKISEHGYDELAADNISVREVVAGIREGVVVEDYPDYPKGPCVLVLEKDTYGRPLHVVWGIPRDLSSPAVLVTAYRPGEESVDGQFPQEKDMSRKHRVKIVHEGNYIAEVDVELIESEEGWSPYLSIEDAYKLDDIRDALRRGDLGAALKLGRVYLLKPVTSAS